MAVRDVVQAAAGIGGDKLYVEDVFSTYLYTGNGSTQTITNGIDLAGEGGLTWFKARDVAAGHLLFDSARGVTKYLISNLTNAEGTSGAGERLTAYNSNGFSLGTDPGSAINASSNTYASWTFRKAPKFFDVVTYTGTGSAQNIAHNLGSAPGFLIVKPIDSTGGWTCWHRSLSNSQYMRLNTTAAVATDTGYWNNTAPTSTQFSVGSTSITNGSGITYVAYLFAHDAGGFGDDGEQNVISCGSFTTNSSGFASVNLGWEPQWILIKNTQTTTGNNWQIVDNMRGWFADTSQSARYLAPNASFEEDSTTSTVNATGFTYTWAPSANHIYIAIRRGPMKTPESGTEVFAPLTYTGDGTDNRLISTGFPVDTVMGSRIRTSGSYHSVNSRIRGTNRLMTQYTNSEDFMPIKFDASSGYYVSETNYAGNSSGLAFMAHAFRRAPGFFDEVCYTGTGVAGRAVLHNLGVAPELLIVKERSGVGNWEVIVKDAPSGLVYYELNRTQAGLASRDGHLCFPTATFVPPTATQFVVGEDDDVNGSGLTYVAYLFASCPGVSKVGSYTGNGVSTGDSLNVDCGFSNGARFVLIKNTGTGSWYVFDSARGITTGNDPYLALNTTDAEDAFGSDDIIDPYSAGFTVRRNTTVNLNGNGETYIYLAIA